MQRSGSAVKHTLLAQLFGRQLPILHIAQTQTQAVQLIQAFLLVGHLLFQQAA
jgi:hypothetical protein